MPKLTHSDEERKYTTWNAGYLEKPIIMTTPTVVGGISSCQCVAYVKAARPDLKFSVGIARNWLRFANTTRPQVGSVVITNESSIGHVAIVSKIEGDNMVLTEKNYKPCLITERIMNINDERILGFIL